ncbi:MAG TPA: hypothetical protein VMD03_08285 [Steroidobacteraceae bacterium]|nr:hypothetical protein [Steroidobacteraceae bacterium]
MTPPRHVIHPRRSAVVALAALATALGVDMTTAARAQGAPIAQQELDWARAALQRNGTLEIVNVDASTGWITVRVRSTGEVRKVFAGAVVATLPSGAPPGAASTSAPASSAPAAPETSSVAGASEAPVPAAPKGERVLASGPGYSIAAAGPPTAASLTESATTGGASLAGGIPVERVHEPIVCQGSRLYHIDSRNLEFDGNAFSVEDGCELVITNSRIVAKGVGIEARGASVHIENSAIEGEVGSIEASGGAQIYASSSTFKGLIRHLDTAAFHDMGGNVGD